MPVPDRNQRNKNCSRQGRQGEDRDPNTGWSLALWSLAEWSCAARSWRDRACPGCVVVWTRDLWRWRPGRSLSPGRGWSRRPSCRPRTFLLRAAALCAFAIRVCEERARIENCVISGRSQGNWHWPYTWRFTAWIVIVSEFLFPSSNASTNTRQVALSSKQGHKQGGNGAI